MARASPARNAAAGFVPRADGPHVILRHGGTIWLTVKPDDQHLPASMLLALSD